MCTIGVSLVLLFAAAPAQAEILNGYTYTKHPIVLVGGVNDVDALVVWPYFWDIEPQIEDDAWQWADLFTVKRQKTEFIMLSPWQGTRERGINLYWKIRGMITLPGQAGTLGSSTVNIIAHSHGATTSRVAMTLLNKEFPGTVRSLTTIAGPHYGTATADAAKLQCIPSWVTNLVYWGLNRLGDIMTIFTQLTYNLYNFLFQNTPGFVPKPNIINDPNFKQNAYQVAIDFQQEQMNKFNTDPINGFPCAGVWKNGTYGIQNGDHPKYGADATQGDKAGDGLAGKRDVTDPTATLYYSWTGQTDSWWTYLTDISDISMLATWALSQMYCKYGAKDPANTTGLDWAYYLYDVLFNKGENGTYNEIDTDAFIPVTSARFGDYIGTYGPWNHIDEQNHMWGAVSCFAPDPKAIFRQHANRLQKAGR